MDSSLFKILVENREVAGLSLLGWLLAATLGFHIRRTAIPGLQVYTINSLTFIFEGK
jgi:hypothetical protein